MEEINNNQNENLDQNKTEKEQKTVIKVSNPLLSKLIPIIVIVIIVGFAFMFINKKPSVKTTVVSIMQSEKTISQLSALKVPYGGIYIEKDDKGNEKNSFLYKGDVTYSIDFKQIRISEDNNVIKILIPNIQLSRKDIDIKTDSINWIKNHKYETKQLIEILENDLLQKFENNDKLKSLAEESVIETINNFITPIVKSIDNQYLVSISIERKD